LNSFIGKFSIRALQVCGCDKGELDMKSVEQLIITDELLKPCKDRFDGLTNEAKQASGVDRWSRFGQLTGLNANGCFDPINAGDESRICKECFSSLDENKVPKKALINDTWQGEIPLQMRMQSFTFPQGLTPVEASMLSINLCITETTVLPSGT